MNPETPKIGIVSDSPLQRHALSHALENSGFEVCASLAPERISATVIEQQPATAWIVTLEAEEEWEDSLDCLLDHTQAPVLLGLGESPAKHSKEYPRWERRLFSKLKDALDDFSMMTVSEDALNQLDQSPHKPSKQITLPGELSPKSKGEGVERVWILGASLGGPAAVKAFLDELPPNLPVSFIYAQHIDNNFSSVLARVLGRHSNFTMKEAEEGDVLRYGEVMIVPVDHEMVLDDHGRIRFLDKAWPGPYGPSIDQTMLNVSSHFGSKCSTILFSGMGNDGAIAAPVLQAYGSRIWVQSSETCASASMPDSVAATGCASFVGSPEELAAELVREVVMELRPTLPTGTHH